MRRLDGGYFADRYGLAVQESTPAALCIRDLAVDRRARYSEHHLALVHQGNLRGKHRVLTHECFGAVDRIYDPKVFRVATMQAGFLAVKPVRRKARLEDFADGHFAAYIGFSDRRFVRLDADLDIALIQ